MARKIRKKHSDEFKLKVALAAVKGDKSVADMCNEFGVSSSQIYNWKDLLLQRGTAIFADQRIVDDKQKEIDKLHRLLGKASAEIDFLSNVLDQ
jgi:transposase-like protein